MVSHKAEDGNSAQLLVAQAFDDACDITFPIIILYSLEQVHHHQVVVTHPVRFDHRTTTRHYRAVVPLFRI